MNKIQKHEELKKCAMQVYNNKENHLPNNYKLISKEHICIYEK